ncbi:hypothetical protein Tco_0296278 [Tanacetum coccineum]
MAFIYFHHPRPPEIVNRETSHTCCKTGSYQDISCLCCLHGFYGVPDGCKECILEWENLRGGVSQRNPKSWPLGESDEVKGYPRPTRESESALTLPYLMYTLCLHSGDDTERLKTSDNSEVLDQNVKEEKDVAFVSIEEVAEEQSKEIPTVEQLLDEVEKQNKVIRETPESPYDTESEYDFTSHIPKAQDQIMHDSDESGDVQKDSDYESMPEDDLRYVPGFENTDSDNTQGNDVSHTDHIFQDDNAFAERLSLPDHMDHICEEVSSLQSKLGDLLGLLSITLKDCLPSILQESLQSHIPAVSKRLAERQTKLNKKVVKHLNRQFNIFHVAQSDRFARLETELSKTLKSDMGKSMISLVKSGMKEVKDDLKSQAKSLRTFGMDVQSMQTQLNNIQSLLESAGEHQSAETLVESQGEQPADVKVANKESAPLASNNKPSEGKELVVHNSEKKKPVEDDSDEDDNQPLS